ncbi:hypothetical protein CAEBREN_32713 [Caenorhabditis brenneri]|uniref:PDZ domain-containing protein n=1 Tax=Caenorhabditis brenneri TaxID=135651 RepID=G0PM42_CAEBE|nr:hypothetical protein CAEBREN_21359 [Caenorhabditis brenneri]EGT36431.1 hypothetical protein CAEBREN_32713 [Caenorhabditis brenneri]
MEKVSAANNAGEEAKVEIPPPIIVAQEKSGMEKLTIPAERERNIGERKNGYEYSIVVINYKPGLKFGLGIKNVYKNIFVIKADENSLVTGLFNVADRIIDVDGDPVNDNQKCKVLLVKALKEKKVASLLIERGITEKALKDATDEMNEEHNQSVMAPPDVRSIMRKMEAHHNNLRKSPSLENAAPAGGLVPVVPSALTKNKDGKGERRTCVLEDGHKSVIIRMDNEENRDKLKKVEPKEPRKFEPKTPPKQEKAEEPKPETK